MKWFRDLSGEFSFSNHDSRGADARSRDKFVVGIMRLGLNRYAVAEADIPIKACQSASTLPRHI
jgi:hypothetical protein